jgi:hypothetical protein
MAIPSVTSCHPTASSRRHRVAARSSGLLRCIRAITKQLGPDASRIQTWANALEDSAAMAEWVRHTSRYRGGRAAENRNPSLRKRRDKPAWS